MSSGFVPPVYTALVHNPVHKEMGSCKIKEDNGTHEANCPREKFTITGFAVIKDPV